MLPGVPFPGSPGFDTARTTEPSPQGYESSGYWDIRAQLNERWAIQGGSRIDTQTYDGSDDGEQWSPRISVLYTLSPQTQVRASVAASSSPRASTSCRWRTASTRSIRRSTPYHWILGVDHAFAAGLDLRSRSVSCKDYRHINPRFENIFDPLVLLPEAEFDRVRIAPDDARATGSGNAAAAAAARLVERLAELQLVARGGSCEWHGRAAQLGSAPSHEPRHRLVERSVERDAERQLSHRLADDSAGSDRRGHGQSADRALAPQSRRLSDYNTLDLRVTRTFALPRGALDVFVEVTNALSRANACCIKYEVTRNPDGTLNYSRDEDSWLPLVPSAGVLWRY